MLAGFIPGTMRSGAKQPNIPPLLRKTGEHDGNSQKGTWMSDLKPWRGCLPQRN